MVHASNLTPGNENRTRANPAPMEATSSAASLKYRDVALQVAFERQTLKPVFHLIGCRLWVVKAIGYGLWVNLIQRAAPHRDSGVITRGVA
jgi:hypothetical protein